MNDIPKKDKVEVTYKVVYETIMETEVSTPPGGIPSIQGMIFDIPVPANDYTKYAKDSFEILRVEPVTE